ncbi:MAG: glycoside hydrolase family 15 protein [Firmicutes bacterium]|nr:glycoside hydrolase family 15 protein [Bacillota bacterium]
MNLKERSIQIIKENQHPGGAFIASPNFPNYRFCWLRDGTFIAYALDLNGEHEAARKFYTWVNTRLQEQTGKIDLLGDKIRAREELSSRDFLPTRYTLEGAEHEDDWPNFQLDGYGAWLWGLAEHLRLTGAQRLPEEFAPSIRATVKYLALCWQFPNYDCWEEYPDKIHTSTLICLYGGILAAAGLLAREDWVDLAGEIKGFIVKNQINNGHLVKYVGSEEVDASLLWAALPFNLLAPDDPVMQKTVQKVEADLLHQGVHRYAADTYYGGGEWVHLTAWLGWYYARTGRKGEARQLLSWVGAQADADGSLPEQVCAHLNDPAFYPIWIERWGPVAKPLLWAHAMYLVLLHELEANGQLK